MLRYIEILWKISINLYRTHFYLQNRWKYERDKAIHEWTEIKYNMWMKLIYFCEKEKDIRKLLEHWTAGPKQNCNRSIQKYAIRTLIEHLSSMYTYMYIRSVLLANFLNYWRWQSWYFSRTTTTITSRIICSIYFSEYFFWKITDMCTP